MNEAPQIELRGVDVASDEEPERLLVRNITWEVHPGDWWVICGGPGSGKTALLSTAAGLNRPTAGLVKIFHRDLADASESDQTIRRREIGFVFENGGCLLGRLSVAENVALPLRYHGDLDAGAARMQVDRLLRLAGLEEFADLAPSRLNLALRQRVALLRSLAASVQILFLDSPLRGLAPSGIRWWLDFLRELRARRAADGEPLSLIVSAYDFRALREDATRFAVIENAGFRVLTEATEVESYREDAALLASTADKL